MFYKYWSNKGILPIIKPELGLSLVAFILIFSIEISFAQSSVFDSIQLQRRIAFQDSTLAHLNTSNTSQSIDTNAVTSVDSLELKNSISKKEKKKKEKKNRYHSLFTEKSSHLGCFLSWIGSNLHEKILETTDCLWCFKCYALFCSF